MSTESFPTPSSDRREVVDRREVADRVEFADRREVVDRDDPAIAAFVSLRDPVVRGELRCFVAEGPDVLAQAVSLGLEVVCVLIDGRHPTPPGLSPSCSVFAASPKLIGEITGLGVHRGVLALVHRPRERTLDETLVDARRVVVLERVENPVNVGLIARSAAGLGIDALLVDATSADPLFRRAVTASRGATLHIPWVRIASAAAALDGRGFLTVALTPDPAAADVRTIGLADADRVALLVGTEGTGLGAATLAAADLRARIPMARGVDSLNVATATAIACWELTR